jgi:hypothetical protein
MIHKVNNYSGTRQLDDNFNIITINNPGPDG